MAENLYRPPAADLTVPLARSADLARRGSRLLAAVVDQLALVLAFGAAMFLGQVIPSGWNPARLAVLGAVAITYLAINLRLMATRGQSVGKRVVGVRVVRRSGEPCSLARYLARTVAYTVITKIPLIGLIDVLAIFAADQRCVHDHIADTIVVNA